MDAEGRLVEAPTEPPRHRPAGDVGPGMNGRRSKLVRAVAAAWARATRKAGTLPNVSGASAAAILAAVGADSPAVRRKLARELRRGPA